MPLIPLLVGGGMLFAAGGTTGYVLGVKTSNLAMGVGLGAAAYLVYRSAK